MMTLRRILEHRYHHRAPPAKEAVTAPA